MNPCMEVPHQVAACPQSSTFASQLVGVWTLVSYTDEQPDGEDIYPLGPQPRGFLIYTADGFVSAQLMKSGRSAFHSSDWHRGTPEEYRESGSGYIAYCGNYEVDEEKAKVIHTPSVALMPNLINRLQCRSIVELHGDRLTLWAAGVPLPNGHFVTSRLEWKRANPTTTASV
jgi:hypothetical protein